MDQKDALDENDQVVLISEADSEEEVKTTSFMQQLKK